MPRRKDLMNKDEINKALSEDKIVIRMKGFDYFSKYRQRLLTDCFNKKHKCKRCGKKSEIQIHHLYGLATKNIITTFEEFCEIPWVPLCRKCHMQEHNVQSPEKTNDD